MAITAAALCAASACSPEERAFGSGSSSSSSSSGMAGSGGAGGGVTVDYTTVCMDYAQANCNSYAQCSPYLLGINFGNMETCIERSYLFCKDIVTLPGTSWNEATLGACTGALNAIECNQFKQNFFRGGPPECHPPPGTLPDGSACSEPAQCASAYCKPMPGSVCGSCVPLGDKGFPCNIPLDCAGGLTCWGGLCAPEAPVGAACDAMTPCVFPAQCRNGVCEPPWPNEGDACNPMVFGDCDGFNALYCDPQTAVCKAAQLVLPGDFCGFMNGQRFDCAGAGVCDQNLQPPTCVAPAPEGAACDAKNGPGCLLPAFCINNTCVISAEQGCGL